MVPVVALSQKSPSSFAVEEVWVVCVVCVASVACDACVACVACSMLILLRLYLPPPRCSIQYSVATVSNASYVKE